MPRRVRIVALLLAAVIGVLSYRSDYILFVLPEKFSESVFHAIGRHLRKSHGIQFLATFDEPVPLEWIGRRRLNAPGTT